MSAPPPRSDSIQTLIQDLVQDQNLVRIKKLLIYVCKQTWETDPVRINYVNLADLVQELLHLAPTLDRLNAHLQQAVQTLNKPAEYALIANAIVNHFTRLYAAEELTQVVQRSDVYEAIANHLQADPDSLRIKKLLFSACSGTWENDQKKLQSINLTNLIKNLHELTSDLENLKAVLDSVVKTLNRQAEYSLVANKIITAFADFYPATHSDNLADSAESTQMIVASAYQASPYSEVYAERIEHPAAQPELSPIVVSESISEPAPVASAREPIDPFDLRVEIMKFTNPLRAKILLFSLLYQPIHTNSENLDPESWSIMRSHPLNDLLTNLLQTYSTSVELERNLKKTADRLKETDQYLQAASAIIRATKPHYDNLPATPSQLETHTPQSNAASASRKPVMLSTSDAEDTGIFVPAQSVQVDDSDDDYTAPLRPAPYINPTDLEK